MIKSSIFKSYDVRGIYPDQLNEATAFEVGRGFIKHTNAKKVAVGYDARLSSPELFRSLSEGIISQGAEVYFIGRVPTEGLYFAVAKYDCDSGIMITASHNPKEYNGFKMITKENGVLQMIRGKDLFSTIEKNGYTEVPKGKINEKDIWEDFFNFTFGFLGSTKKFQVVVDASNGVMGEALDKIIDKLPVEVIKLNFEPNGNFPNHSPNPLEKGSSDQISELVKNEGADFGIIFDGDADRIFLVDELGKLVPADIVLLLLAKYFLTKNPGKAIAYNAICSKAVSEFVEKWGGKPIRTQVGFVNVREGLMKNDGIMGGELSGHYCFADYWYMDSGMITFLTLLQIISSEGKKVSEIISKLSIYSKAEDNFEVEEKEAILEKIKEKYASGKQDFLDGVTIEYKDWWFNVRPSNTEPLLRLTIEADTKELLEEKQKELSEIIKN
ncbi:MAG: phosphomannomutase/phosphoglucomutase [Candidatus Staskawiczbacteria bacterium]|nr:phosphomannomutase/phosphoglucomutase [Candidatus Staskawiczbacteria bacterium]